MNYALVTEVHFIHEVLSSVGVINVCVRARVHSTHLCVEGEQVKVGLCGNERQKSKVCDKPIRT